MADQYDNRGKIALWRPNTDNAKAPQAKGSFTAHRDIKEGEVIYVALWKVDSDNPKAPVMNGKIQDRQEKQGGQSQGGGENPPDDPDDDLPF